MILDTRQRLRAIERALNDVIIPAIDPAMANAVEQANYAAMHLRLMVEQVNWEYPMELAEMRHFSGLAQSLCETLGPRADGAQQRARDVITRAAALSDVRLPAFAETKGLVGELRAACDGLLAEALAADTRAVRDGASEAVLTAARRHELRSRAWIQDAGYEKEPTPSLADAVDDNFLTTADGR